MQRSMVHELTSSQFINNRSTFISTALNQGDYQLRKSRIQNLPSYRKQDMSSRVNFVVVFQTIEIQRLSNEVEALRIALKDEQRQNFNVKSYEVQIRELTQRCFAYQNQRHLYREEVDKLNVICEKLYEELETLKVRYGDIDPTIKQKYRLEKQRTRSLQQDIQKWKTRYHALQTSKSRQMQDMKLMMQSQRKSTIDRQIKQLTLKFNTQRQSLQKQIRKLRQAIDVKDTQLQRINSKLSQLQIVNQQLKQYQRTIDDYQSKFAMISQETMRLNDLLRRKQEEIQRLGDFQSKGKRRIQELERKLKQLEENGGEKARMLENQLKDWRSKYSRLEEENKSYQRDLSQIPQFKQAIQQISKQSQRLKDAVKQKMGEIDDWKGKYQRIQVQYRDARTQQQQRIPALQSKLSQLANQNDRVSSILKTRTSQLQNIKQKLIDTDRQLSRIPSLQQQKRNFQSTINTQIKQINDLQGNIRQLEGQARRVNDLQKQVGRQRQEKEESKREIGRLNGIVQGNASKLEGLQRKCDKLQRDLKNFTQIQSQLTTYKQKQITLTKQIDRINGIIIQKIKQLQQLKQLFQRYQNKMNQYKNLQQKLTQSVDQTQKLIHDLDQSRKQTTMLQDKLFTLQSQVKKYQADVYSLNQQQQNLTRLVGTRSQELQQCQSELSQAQSQITRLNAIQSKYRQLQQKSKNLQQKSSQLQKRNKTEQSRNQALTQSLQSLTLQHNKLKKQGSFSPKFKQQYIQLIKQTELRQKQHISLIRRILKIEQILKKLIQVIKKQQLICKKNGQKIGQFSKQFDIVSATYKKNIELLNQVYRLNQENMELESKVRISSVENMGLKESKGVGMGTKSPIDMLATKRNIDEEYGSPGYRKSSSTSNMTSIKTYQTSPNVPQPQKQSKPQQNDYYNYSYQSSYTNPNQQSYSNTNTNSYANTYTNSYTNQTSIPAQSTTTTTITRNTSASPSASSTLPISFTTQRNKTNATYGYGESQYNSGGTGYGMYGGRYGQSNDVNQQQEQQYSYEYTKNKSSSNIPPPDSNTYSYTSTYTTNTDTNNMPSMGGTFGRKGSYQTLANVSNSNSNKNESYINFEAFGKKNTQAIGVKPAGLPFQFRTSRPQF